MKVWAMLFVSNISISDKLNFYKIQTSSWLQTGFDPELDFSPIKQIIWDRQCNTAALSNIPIEIFVICDVSVLNYLEFYNIPDSN